MKLRELVDHLDAYLRVADVPDSTRAWNGLQLENGGTATRVAAAVDASEAAVAAAADAGCDVLLVHHGLFWGGFAPVTDRRYRKLKRALDAGLAIYSAHLPLDVHPEVGNNAVLASRLGIEAAGRFGSYDGHEIGVWGRLDTDREALARRLSDLVGGPVHVVRGGPARIASVGVITGGAGEMIGDALAAGLDAFVTGEGAHHTYFDAVEGGINVYYAGHYATETWGVRALAEHIESRFGLPWQFIDQPTGL